MTQSELQLDSPQKEKEKENEEDEETSDVEILENIKEENFGGFRLSGFSFLVVFINFGEANDRMKQMTWLRRTVFLRRTKKKIKRKMGGCFSTADGGGEREREG